MRQQRQRLHGPEEIPGRERKGVVILGRRAGWSGHDLGSASRDEPEYPCRINTLRERIREFTREVLALAHAGVVECFAFYQCLLSNGVDVGPADDDREIRALALDPPGDLNGARKFHGHARDPDEVGWLGANTAHDVVHGQVVELAIQEPHVMTRGAERLATYAMPSAGNRAQWRSNSLRGGG